MLTALILPMVVDVTPRRRDLVTTPKVVAAVLATVVAYFVKSSDPGRSSSAWRRCGFCNGCYT